MIRVENVGKKYLIRHQKRESYTALRDVIANKIKSIGKASGFQTKEEFWALKDISFDINQGDRVGIIGRNGAGKSTLLKLLSRITEPTKGKISITGRVASLLEVGTGFHPELTGRENIFLNGAIMGMSKEEIKNKFDEIVAFSEVEKFLDTPVKRYSSGMYVRLAFAVAAHLDAQILIIDEVLAVGDISFQKKCLGKIDEIGKDGRTVLFVSHNMPMISSLCNKCILLHEGKIIKQGVTTRVIQSYYSEGVAQAGKVDFSNDIVRHGDDTAHILKAQITNNKGEPISEVYIEDEIFLEMEYAVTIENACVTPNFHVHTPEGEYAFMTLDSPIDPLAQLKKKPGIYRTKCIIPRNLLNAGTYSIGFGLASFPSSKMHFLKQHLLNISVVERIDDSLTRGVFAGDYPGVIRPLLKWECEFIS